MYDIISKSRYIAFIIVYEFGFTSDFARRHFQITNLTIYQIETLTYLAYTRTALSYRMKSMTVTAKTMVDKTSFLTTTLYALIYIKYT